MHWQGSDNYVINTTAKKDIHELLYDLLLLYQPNQERKAVFLINKIIFLTKTGSGTINEQ